MTRDDLPEQCWRCGHNVKNVSPFNHTCGDAGCQGSDTPRCGCSCVMLYELREKVRVFNAYNELRKLETS